MSKKKVIVLAFVIIITILFFSIWFVVTQPLFWIQQSKSKVTVDPTRLEKHVQMLSEVFVPRDYRHPQRI